MKLTPEEWHLLKEALHEAIKVWDGVLDKEADHEKFCALDNHLRAAKALSIKLKDLAPLPKVKNTGFNYSYTPESNEDAMVIVTERTAKVLLCSAIETDLIDGYTGLIDNKRWLRLECGAVVYKHDFEWRFYYQTPAQFRFFSDHRQEV
jgi:hypothetical protein